jgi:hypothetical protein
MLVFAFRAGEHARKSTCSLYRDSSGLRPVVLFGGGFFVGFTSEPSPDDGGSGSGVGGGGVGTGPVPPPASVDSSKVNSDADSDAETDASAGEVNEQIKTIKSSSNDESARPAGCRPRVFAVHDTPGGGQVDCDDADARRVSDNRRRLTNAIWAPSSQSSPVWLWFGEQMMSWRSRVG